MRKFDNKRLIDRLDDYNHTAARTNATLIMVGPIIAGFLSSGLEYWQQILVGSISFLIWGCVWETKERFAKNLFGYRIPSIPVFSITYALCLLLSLSKIPSSILIVIGISVTILLYASSTKAALREGDV